MCFWGRPPALAVGPLFRPLCALLRALILRASLLADPLTSAWSADDASADDATDEAGQAPDTAGSGHHHCIPLYTSREGPRHRFTNVLRRP